MPLRRKEMSVSNEIAKINKRGLQWAAISFWTGVIIGLMGIYLTLYYEKRPNLVYEITSNATILDIREELNKLDIYFDGRNIKHSNQTLSVLTLKIINNGQTDILENHFDSVVPFGFVVPNGSVVEEPTLLHGSNTYLETGFKAHLDSPNKVTFTKKIFEPGEYVILKILVLHTKGIVPGLWPTGKVAGIKRIEAHEPYRTEETVPFYARVFNGNVGVQFVRMVAYAVAFFVVVVVIGWLVLTVVEKVAKFADRKERSKREEIVKGFASSYGKKGPEGKENYLLKMYKDSGEWYLLIIKNLLKDKHKLNFILSSSDKERSEFIELFRYGMSAKMAKDLYNAGLLVKGSKGINVDRGAKQTLHALLRYIESIGHKKNSSYAS